MNFLSRQGVSIRDEMMVLLIASAFVVLTGCGGRSLLGPARVLLVMKVRSGSSSH